ncbi:MAG TPA: 16S rRNA (uracil(1498)-N(3))-methyltransferase [Gemmataceae bacterium]|nr:16S rRNA (uracil(1498)-N(3))-methyltransferase [Gemmataceae bacterium]
MSERFYVNLPLTLGPFMLDGPEAHHLATVCRLRPGDAICLFNGNGREYRARINKVARRDIVLDIVAVDEPARELPMMLEVAAPVPKGDRGQFLVEKLTELGVTTFVPLLCQRSNTHPRETRRDKLERHVIEASKQCGRNVLMRVADPMDWTKYASSGQADDLRILAHPHQARTLAEMPRPKAVTRIAVGPEGGFTDEEIALAQQLGWQMVSLGPRILRIETAAMVLAALMAERATL